MARYQLQPIGVLDTVTGQRLVPQSGALWEAYIAWRAAGNDPDQYVAPVAPAETLAQAKTRKRYAIKAEGLSRVQARFPALDSFDALLLAREMYLSIAAAARTPTADWQYVIDVFQAGQTGLAAVTSASSIAAVDAVTVAWPT